MPASTRRRPRTGRIIGSDPLSRQPKTAAESRASGSEKFPIPGSEKFPTHLLVFWTPTGYRPHKQRSPVPALHLDSRDFSDLRLLAWGAYDPLPGFVGADDHAGVVADMRLTSGALFPFPIAPALTDGQRDALDGASEIELVAPSGAVVGTLAEPEIYTVDVDAEIRATYGTDDAAHPGVAVTLAGGPHRVGGKVVIDAAHPALLLSSPFD
ncbi:MAG: hypothetical protein ACRDWD_01685, partial [Acidimicrobiia bacterium]